MKIDYVISQEPDFLYELEENEYALEGWLGRELKIGEIITLNDWNYEVVRKIDKTTYILYFI